jgi:serine/threonine-protein kinase
MSMRADSVTADAHLSFKAGQSVAGYRLIRLLGQGVNGAVYLAEQARRPLPVALKLMPLPQGAPRQAARDAFSRSIETVRHLKHPGIVTLHAAGLEGTLAWLAMEVVAGGDLTRYTRAQRLLPEPLVLRLCQRVAQALAYAHRQGVVHRDVKPANVLVDWSIDSIKLADFGLARAADSVQTGTGIVPGSPAYMAPEQLAGAVPTPRSDLYALGVMLFQLLAGRLPHEGASMGELLRHVAEAAPPDLGLVRPDLPAGVADLAARLMARNPAERPADGDSAARELASLVQSWPPAR